MKEQRSEGCVLEERPFRASKSLQGEALWRSLRMRRIGGGQGQHGLKRLYRRVNSVLFVLGVVFALVFLPVASMTQKETTPYQGWGAAHVAHEMPTCGTPEHVFRQMGYEARLVPSKTELAKLPRPQDVPLMKQGDVTYDPARNELCTVGWIGLYTRYIQPQQQLDASTQHSPTSGNAGVEWVQQILTGLMMTAAQGLSGFLNGVLGWATSFGFLFMTPGSLTYDHPVVRNLHQWVLGVIGSALVLVLVVLGYSALFNQGHVLKEYAPRLVLSLIAAAASLFFIQQFIELHNSLCLGVQGALATAGIGDLSLPFGVVNWVTAPVYEILTYVLELIVAVLLCLQMAARIALLDLIIVTAPLGLLCFALPQTVAWGRLWAQAFVSTLIVQFLQVLCVGTGSALVASYGHASATPVTLLIGIATLYIAFKLPGMLLSNVLRASVGEVQRDVVNTTKTVAETAAVCAA